MRLRVTIFLGIFAIVSILAAAWSYQRPWRKSGAIHVVGLTNYGNVQVAVVQKHDYWGLNTSFVAARHGLNDRWQMFFLGHEDLYWRSVEFRLPASNIVEVARSGKLLGSFDIVRFDLFLLGRGRDSLEPQSETLQLE